MELEGQLYQSSSEDALAFHLGSFSSGSNRDVLDQVQQPYVGAMIDENRCSLVVGSCSLFRLSSSVPTDSLRATASGCF